MITSETYSPNVNIIDLLSGDFKSLPPLPSGSEISCKSWEQESVLRMLINHSELSVSPHFIKLPAYEYETMVDWETLKDNVTSLLNLENNETLVIESVKPKQILKSTQDAPRVISINSVNNEILPTKENSLHIYNKMWANSWSSIGLQDIIDDNYRIFESIAQKYFGGTLEGKIAVTSGFGYAGAAQSLAITMNKGVAVVVEMNRKLIEKMIEDGYCARVYEDIETVFDVAGEAKRNGQSRTLALLGNASEMIPELVNKGIIPNIVTDATNTRDLVNGYFPAGYSFVDALRIRRADTHHYRNLNKHSMMMHVKAMVELNKRGSLVFEYGNDLREKALDRGFENAFGFPSFIPDYAYPVLTSKKINFKWIALSASNDDIFAIDDLIVSEFPDNPDLSRVIDIANKIIPERIIPSRKSRIDYADGMKLCREINHMVKNNEISAPVLLSFSKFRENDVINPAELAYNRNESIDKITEQVLNRTTGASWVSLNYHGSENSYYALSEMMVLADGSKSAENRIEQILECM